MTNGAGAWLTPKYYAMTTAGDNPPYPERIRDAVSGIQALMQAHGFACPQNGVYDLATANAVMAFQKDRHIAVDGLYGPQTGRTSIQPLCQFYEKICNIPGPYVQGYCHFEGAWDPGAQGFATPSDYGVVQINLLVQPVTMAQATNPLVAVLWAASKLIDRFHALGNWDAAIIGHRSPLWAQCVVGLQPWPVPYFDPALNRMIDPKQEAMTYIANVKSGA